VEDVSHSEDQDPSRRQLLKKGMLVGLGTAGLVIASAALTAGVAQAGATSIQYGWRYCANCHSLYWGNNPGTCAAVLLSPHKPYSSTSYGIATAVSSTSGFQYPWSYCSACSCLYYGPDISASHCAAAPSTALPPSDGTNPHTAGNTTYYLSYGAQNPSGTQPGWRFCGYCKELFWGAAIAASACPVSYNFANSANPAHSPVDEGPGGPVADETDYNPYIE
jgi:hypothetical protein